MTHTRKTLSLGKKWDLELDPSGRIGTVRGDYATAQNVSNQTRLFTSDAYLSADKGIPHFDVELGRQSGVSADLLRSQIRAAALSVADVAEVTDVTIGDFNRSDRRLAAEVTLKTKEASQDGELRIDI